MKFAFREQIILYINMDKLYKISTKHTNTLVSVDFFAITLVSGQIS